MDLLAHLRSKITREEATSENDGAFGGGGGGRGGGNNNFAAPLPPAAMAAATAARVAAEGGAARLDLRGRGLDVIPAEVWDTIAPGVAHVDFGENSLTGESAIPPLSLEACGKLEVLLLDGNKLTDWPLPTGGGLSTALPLRELSLARNPSLRTAPPGAFARAPLLQKLDLTNVSIPFAHAGFLEPLTKLRELRWCKGGRGGGCVCPC